MRFQSLSEFSQKNNENPTLRKSDDTSSYFLAKYLFLNAKTCQYRQRSPLCNGLYESGLWTPSKHISNKDGPKDARLRGLKIYLQTSSILRSAWSISKSAMRGATVSKVPAVDASKRSVAWNRGNTTPVYLLRRSNVHHFFGGTWIIKDSNLCPSSIARRACHVCHRLGGRQHISKLWEFLQATVLAHKRFGRHVIYDVRLER